MARRRVNKETLSQESPEVQNRLLEELVLTPEPQVETVPEVSEVSEVPEIPKVQQMTSQVDFQPSIVENKKEEVKVRMTKPEVIKADELKVKDRVKIKPEVSHDIVGRRIHNGIKNYLYTVKNVRKDGYVNVECLTYVFTLHSKDLDLVKRG